MSKKSTRKRQAKQPEVVRYGKYVGLTEIADLLNLSTARVFNIVKDYGDFPKPQAELRMGRIWRTADVQAWVGRHPYRPVGRPRSILYKHVRFLNSKEEKELFKVPRKKVDRS